MSLIIAAFAWSLTAIIVAAGAAAVIWPPASLRLREQHRMRLPVTPRAGWEDAVSDGPGCRVAPYVKQLENAQDADMTIPAGEKVTA